MGKFSRRNLLKSVGVLGGGAVLYNNPYTPIFKAIMSGLLNTAQANSQAVEPKNYLLFLMYGAPPRWTWDNFLLPSNNLSDFIANQSVQNVLKGQSGFVGYTGDRTQTAYENGQIYNYLKNGQAKQIYMPLLWDSPLPTWNGTSAVFEPGNPVLMRDYLQHSMIMRGVDMAVDIGHVKGPELVPRPLASEPSLSGLVADASSRLIPAIGMTASAKPYLGYKSLKNNMALTSGSHGQGPLFDILEPFVSQNTVQDQLVAEHNGNEALMKSAMDEALTEIKNYASSSRPGAESLFDSLQNSKNLLSNAASEFNDLKTQFDALRLKYQEVVKASRQSIPGILPEPVDTNSHVDQFSASFALAEFFIKKNIATSFSFDVGKSANAGNIQMVGGGSIRASALNDEHRISDRQMSVISHSFKYRSYMACVHTFREAIGEGAWSNTVLQVGAEYGRRPRNTPDSNGDYGSDHAPGANTYNIMSGAIKNYIPIGNIWIDGAKARTNPGTWGQGSPTLITGQQNPIIISKEIAANTVADLLGVKRPTNAISLIEKDNSGDWVSKCEDPKNKDA